MKKTIELTKNKKAMWAIIIILCSAFSCVVFVVDRVQYGFEQSGYLPTRTPAPTNTKYIDLIEGLHLTQTAQPTNTLFATWTPEPTSTPEKLAWTACTMFIDQQLKLSTFDAQEYNPNGVIKAGDDYLVDIYYAVNDVTYTCFITRDPNGDWRLLELSKK